MAKTAFGKDGVTYRECKMNANEGLRIDAYLKTLFALLCNMNKLMSAQFAVWDWGEMVRYWGLSRD